MISSTDVARLAGVSRAHVSNFFNRPELVSDETRQKIQDAVDQLGYVPNETARRLRRGQTRSESIGVVLVDAWAPFFDQVSLGIEDEAEKSGWSVQFSNSRRDLEREAKLIRAYGAQMTQGLIVFPTAQTPAALRSVIDSGARAVLLDPPHATRDVPEVSSVAVDHVLGGRLAAAHLIERNGQRFAFVGNPTNDHQSADRLEGFSEHLQGSGRLVATSLDAPSMTMQGGFRAGQAFLDLPPKQRPDALFAANDLVALGLVQTLTAAGISVPSDVRIVGYDDIDLAAQANIPLTTVRQPAALLGASAVRLVVDASVPTEGREQTHVILLPEIVVRSST